MSEKLQKTPEQWREELDEFTYYVTREKGTERAFTGEYYQCTREGTYECRCCGQPLFTSESKYDSGCGWPSFFAPIEKQAIDEHADHSHMMHRVEIVCSHCDAHLGHVFPDGPQPTGLRYCVNSASVMLDESKKPKKKED